MICNNGCRQLKSQSLRSGSSYVNTPAEFELLKILPDGSKEGQYIATISRDNTGKDGGPNDEFIMALVLNTNSAGKHLQLIRIHYQCKRDIYHEFRYYKHGNFARL